MSHTKGSIAIVEILNGDQDNTLKTKYGIVVGEECEKQLCLFPMVKIFMFDSACVKHHPVHNVHILSSPSHEKT